MKFTWKQFPEIPLGHAPKLQNVEKVWKKFPGYPLSHRPLFGNSFRDLPIWVNTTQIVSVIPNEKSLFKSEFDLLQILQVNSVFLVYAEYCIDYQSINAFSSRLQHNRKHRSDNLTHTNGQTKYLQYKDEFRRLLRRIQVNSLSWAYQLCVNLSAFVHSSVYDLNFIHFFDELALNTV